MAPTQLEEKIKSDLLKSLKHLKYSYEKVKNIDLSKKEWPENDLQVLYSEIFELTSDVLALQAQL